MLKKVNSGGLLKKLKNNKYLFIIVLLGAFIRVVFFNYGSELYFANKTRYVLQDTYLWQQCISNLINFLENIHSTREMDIL